MNLTSTKIAVVEDELSQREILSFILESAGYCNVTVHSSGEKFLDYFRTDSAEPPDIVILDMKMSGMDGFQVLEEALKSSKFLHTLFVSHSAYLGLPDSHWLGYMGFDYNLPKPHDREDLLNMLKLLIENKENFLSKRNPYQNLFSAISELSRLRLRSAVLENDYIKKLISPEVFTILDSTPDKLIPRNQEVTVGFVDIRGFTQLTNRLQIHQINEILKLFFDHSIRRVNRWKGYTDKFIGDSVMWFHVSNSAKENCERSIRAASDIIRDSDELNDKIQSKLHVKLNIHVGIGIACGIAAVGVFGAPELRIQYSVLGPPVNLASRLCSEANPNEIVIGGEIIEYCPFKTKKIGFREIKGFDHKVELRKVIIPKKASFGKDAI